MKAPRLFVVGSIILAGMSLASFARANETAEFIDQNPPRHFDDGKTVHYRTRPNDFGFTPAEYYHENPIVIFDEPYFPNRLYMGATIGFTFGPGADIRPHKRVHHHVN